jgi:hypothetical protein
MAFTKDEGTFITLDEGSRMTAEFRKTISPGDTIAHAVGANLVTAILSQENCNGIRMYYGLDENGNKQLVLVGVDANGDDITNGFIVDHMLPCPVTCSQKNSLNS